MPAAAESEWISLINKALDERGAHHVTHVEAFSVYPIAWNVAVLLILEQRGFWRRERKMDGDTAQWFSALGTCRCGKPATGELKSFYHNNVLARCCGPCAERRIKAAHKLKQFEPDCVVRERASK
jgi:hypothetical protein